VELGHELLGHPVIASATTLIVQDNGTVYALDRASGAEQWRYTYEVGVLHALDQAPAVADGLVYAAAFDDEETGIIVALDAERGEERWRFRASHPKLAKPSVVAGTVFVGSEGAVYALDAASGAQRWVAEVPGLVGSALAVAEGSVYVHIPGTVLALDATTGEEDWRAEQEIASEAPPVVAGGLVYVGGDALAEEGVAEGAGFFALDAATGELVWHLPVGPVYAAPAVVGTSVLFQTADRAICAFAARDGDASGSGRPGAGAYVSPILFSSAVDAHDRPVDAHTTFTDVSTLYAGVDLVGMDDGTPYQISWAHDGDVLGVLDETWSETSAGRYLSRYALEEGVIPAGEWEVVVTVDGEVVRRATASIRVSGPGT
jgi:outer membrane protein assembly factor BamB